MMKVVLLVMMLLVMMLLVMMLLVMMLKELAGLAACYSTVYSTGYACKQQYWLLDCHAKL